VAAPTEEAERQAKGGGHLFSALQESQCRVRHEQASELKDSRASELFRLHRRNDED